MSTNVYDWTTVTSPSEALDWFNNSIRKAAEYNVFGNKTVFEAIVLADAFPLSVNDDGNPIFTDNDAEATAQGISSRFAFKARIVGTPSPHAFLPDPCNPQYATQSSFLNTSIIDSHTTFTSQVGYSTGPGKRPKTGDIVEVRLKPGPNGYDLQYGDFIKILDSYRHGAEENTSSQCMSLEALFEISPGSGPPTTPPATSKPRFITWESLTWQVAPLRNLLNFIASGEGGYTAVNRGVAGDSPGLWSDYTNSAAVSIFNSNIVDSATANPNDHYSTLHQSLSLTALPLLFIQGIQRNGSLSPVVSNANVAGSPETVQNKQGFLAVGRYQITPEHFAAINDGTWYVTDIPMYELYSTTNQDKLAAALLLKNHPSLGSYLMGTYEHVEHAAQDLAKIWASVPLQWAESWRGVRCERGQSKYCSVGGNRSFHTPEQTIRKLEEARRLMAAAIQNT